MIYIAADTIEAADARSAEFWDKVRGPGWDPNDTTQFLYPRRARTGDAEADADLPDGVDAAIVVAARDDWLDTLIADDNMEPQEIGECAELYPAWEPGVAYIVGSLVEYNDALYKCRQAHTAISAWQPDVVLALWLRYRKDADTLLAWVGNEPVQVGWQRTYGGATYTCIQAHVTQADWTPPVAQTLWQPL